LDAVTAEYTREYQCFDAGHSLWPLVIIIIFAITTGMVSVFVLVCSIYSTLLILSWCIILI
jgi:hypothetical protein